MKPNSRFGYDPDLEINLETRAIIYFFIFASFLVSCKKKEKSSGDSSRYLFYLHGGIVQEQGPGAISPQFGPYQYFEILDTLRSFGFVVISEVRPKSTEEIQYARKVSIQIDSLQNTGVKPDQIIVVGASLGAYIAVETAKIQKDPEVRYVLIGLCSDYALDRYLNYREELCGNFLSIYEKSDQKGSCNSILDDLNCKTGYIEIQTDTGLGHGFLYTPNSAWVDPLVKWINGT